jgi:hypothetical protein
MNWWEWVFSGIGVFVIGLFLQRWLKSSDRTATLTAQGAKVSGSPVASGTGITQNVNEIHYHSAQPTGESPRSDKIHERQVESLLLIHSKLEEALFYFQRAAAAGKFAGEASDEELLRRMAENLGAASKEFGKSRLLFSESLVKKLDEFFNKMLSGSISLNLALSPMVQDGYQRAKLWDEARDTANKEIPPLLNAIRDESRGVIHG